ncbi:MAG: NUDIX domain-containing protein [Spirochaetes bacterium]|nr:NUDIX domain-containing protein [Spirochaetota bacterium]
MEYFDVLNEQGQVVGKASRDECHSGTFLLHPVIHIHVFNKKKQILLQKRARSKKIQPDKWDTSVGGHISSGESVEQAVLREAEEELGIQIDLTKLIFLGTYTYQSELEREWIHSFIYYYDGMICFQEEEIEEVRFFTHSEIIKLMEKKETTPNFVKEYHLFLQKNQKIAE